MSLSRPTYAAALASLLLAATLWLPAARSGGGASLSADGPVAATYALPLAA
ncbi:hypothetical protein GGQ88_001030 [Novosphingobium hassiacum]|uniref:Uncharacterized protein n=1 Tax=Novosphingobium hassiacum TaxID=173676 RepID=A0A7W5ZWI6_9SPHN|nr:hypothetical protein [Novosphingobium hassiacum]MBB3859769.1 hypothetical protein [Novosphingobium hassiacum]